MLAMRHTLLVLMLACPCWAGAQEVKFIDLSSIKQHTQLRFPPAPQGYCPPGASCGTGTGFSSGSVADGAPDWRDPRALGVWLVHVTPTNINPLEPFQVEFLVRNTGRASIEIPVSPNLSELQPEDDTVAFTYLSLSLVVVAGEEPNLGYVSLFGSQAHKGTVLRLRPGEWVRVKANLKLDKWPQEVTSVDLHGMFWLRRVTFRPGQGGASTEMDNLYPNATRTPPVHVHLIRPTPPDLPQRHRK
jgi:hypothetical protein